MVQEVRSSPVRGNGLILNFFGALEPKYPLRIFLLANILEGMQKE